MLKLTADEYEAVGVVRVARGLQWLSDVFRMMGLDQVQVEAKRIREGLSRVGS
jgi:hypothetical protein